MPKSLAQIAEFVGGRVAGDAATLVVRVASAESARAGDIVFVEQESGLEGALAGACAGVITGEFAAGVTGKPLVIVEHPRLAFARAGVLLRPRAAPTAGVHASAVVDASARIGEGVCVGAGAVVGEDVVVGDGSWIGAGVVIQPGVVVGKECDLYPRVVVYSGTSLGDRVTVHAGSVVGSDGFGYVRDGKTGRYEKFPQIGTLRIGDDVEIGANATVDRGALDATVIGRGTKIDNLVHVGHNVRIGEDVVIAAQTGISGSSVIGAGVVVAGQVGIGDHVRVESGAILGAQCGVPSNKVIRGKGVFWGTPARPLAEYLRELAVLARMAKKKS